MKRVLLTGASGFIGRHTLPLLAQRGFDVHAVCSSAAPRDLPDAKWHCCNLLDTAAVSKLMQAVEPTHLLHLAWHTEPSSYWTSLENFRWVQASLHLLDEFHRSAGVRAVMAGTCAEYDRHAADCNEATTPLIPSSTYGKCKHALQQLIQAYSAASAMSTAWGRIFYVYGPHEKPGRLVPSVIRSLLANDDAPCTHGGQLRDFLHVEDVAGAFVALLDSSAQGPVNIASGHAIAIKDLVTLIGNELKRMDLVQFGAIPVPAHDPERIAGDPTLLTQLGWRPVLSHENGIRKTVAWWRAQLRERAR